MGLRVLLLQARNDADPMREHEHACFTTRTALPGESIVCHNLVDGAPTMRQLAGFDALMVGGSGEYNVSEANLPCFEPFRDFLREVVEAGHATFASCYGYQSIVEALGGSVVSDPVRREVGTYEMTLTSDGERDPLFGNLPPRFLAQMGHKDRAERPPDGAINLASSERCRFQALRIPGKPIWATQFHPELDRATNTDRFRRYIESYGTPEDKRNLDAALERFRESPESSSLLRSFLDLVFG